MRTVFNITTLVFIIIAPYWLYLPLIFIGIILFPLYLESIALALLVDTLYGHFFFTPISAGLVLFAVPLRSHLRFNA